MYYFLALSKGLINVQCSTLVHEVCIFGALIVTQTSRFICLLALIIVNQPK